MDCRQTVAAPSLHGPRHWAAAVYWGVRLVRNGACQNTSVTGQFLVFVCPVECPLWSSSNHQSSSSSPPLPHSSNSIPPPATLWLAHRRHLQPPSSAKPTLLPSCTDTEFRLLKKFLPVRIWPYAKHAHVTVKHTPVRAVFSLSNGSRGMLADLKLKESLSSQPHRCPEDLARAIAAPRLDGSLVEPISLQTLQSRFARR